MSEPRCLLRFISVVLGVLAFTNQIAAQESQFFEPKEGFYRARGIRVTAVWSLDRVTLPEDDELLATLTIRGAANPHEIVRPDLRKLKAFAENFRSIVDVPGPMVLPDAAEVAFVYRLRPRDRSVNRLPSLDFYVLNPAIKNRNPFENARVKGIDLVVTAAAPQPPPAPIPLAEPESLFKLETGSGILAPVGFHPGFLAWFAIGILGPILAMGWVLVWRRLYPDAARLAHLRRGLAARRALTAIHRAARGHEPASVVATAMRDYLHARFGVPSSAVTPAELDAALQQTGVEPRADVVKLFRQIDELRFAPASDNVLSVVTEAEAVIARLEALVC